MEIALGALMFALVAVCGWMLYKVYASQSTAGPGTARTKTSRSTTFPDLIAALLERELRDLPDVAIRFALKSRLEAAVPLGETSRSLALLEVFFELERLGIAAPEPEAV